jgi:hypothetical protein
VKSASASARSTLCAGPRPSRTRWNCDEWRWPASYCRTCVSSANCRPS